MLVLATGFKSHEFVAPLEIQGPHGTLAEAWGDVPRAYLGVTVPDFPNLFLLYGPNTNGGTGSVVATLESSMQHVLAALKAMRGAGASRIEVRREAADAFDAELRDALRRTVWHTGCTNWYVDEHGNDPSQWPWSWSAYRRRTARLDPAAYAAQLERLTAGVARVEVVPELDVVLAVDPAQVDLGAVADGREVDQAAVEVAQDDPARVEGGDPVLELDEGLADDLAGLAAAVGRRAVGERLTGLGVGEPRAGVAQGEERAAHPAELRAGFLECEVASVAHDAGD